MTLQYYLEHFGVGVAAITGVLAARGKRVDLFGVVVLALVTAFGGGTIRDCTLGSLPVFWVKDPNFIYTAVAAAGFTFLVGRHHEFPQTVLLVADAFALALFTMLGLTKAATFFPSPAIWVTMGVITGVAGGIMRDLLVGEIPLVFRREIYLYATAALIGSLVYVVLAKWSGAERANLVAGVLVILLLRLAGIRWKLSLPVFVPHDEINPS